MERLTWAPIERERDFLERFTDYPWFPLPPWTPLLLLGDLLVFGLLFTLMTRQHRLAGIAHQAGKADRQILRERKAGIYLKIIKISIAVTLIPHLLWVFSIYTLPSWVSYSTPLPNIMGVLIYTPFLVWITPLVALVVELRKNNLQN